MKKRTIFAYLMPSIADIIFLRIFFNAMANGMALLYDGDTGWHLVTGDNILKTFRVPFNDPYSHTLPNTSWTAHEWLAEVIFAALHRMMGLNGVILLSATIIASTFFLLFRYLIYKKVSPPVAALFTIVAIWASTIHWLARPHIFSFLLTLGFIIVLDLYQREGRDYLLFLPVMMLFWVNVHGGYILGLILIMLYIGGNILIAIVTPERRQESRVLLKKLALVFGFTMISTFVNPRGPAILIFPFHLVGRQFIMDNVSEWLSPNFHKQVVFEAMLLLFILTLVVAKRKLDIFELLLFFLLVHMSLYSQRYIPLLAIIVTPIAALRFTGVLDHLAEFLSSFRVTRDLPDIFSKISNNVSSLEARFTSHFWVYAAVVICLAIGLNGGRVGQKQVWEFSHDKERFPVDAVSFAVENNIDGRMFNNDSWGGYIIYKTYPRYQVFMDGRSDMYGEPLLREYVKFVTAQLGYEEVLDKYEVTWVLFNANAPICQLLAKGGKWRLVYADQTANILLKDLPENRHLIDKYPGIQFVPKEEKY